MQKSMKSLVVLGACLVLILGITGCDDDDSLPDAVSFGTNEVAAIAQGTTTALDTVLSLAVAGFSQNGAQVVELGPVNASIHGIDEHVSVEELEILSRIYERILEKLLL